MFRDINIFFAREEKLLILFFLILSIVNIFVEFIGLGTIPILISFFLKNNFLNESLVSSDFFNELISNFTNYFKQINFIIIICFFLTFIFIFKNILILFIVKFEEKLFRKITIRNAKNLYTYYLSKSYLYHVNSNPQILAKTITLDIQVIKTIFLSWAYIIKELLILIGLFVFLLLLNPTISLFLFIVLLITGYFFYLFVNSNVQKKGRYNNEIRNFQLSHINQVFTSIKDIKIFNKENFLINIFEKKMKLWELNNTYINIVNKIPKLLFETIIIFILSLTCSFLILIGYSYEDILFYLGAMAVFGLRCIPSFNVLSMAFNKIKTFKSIYKNIKNELIESNQFLKSKDKFYETKKIKKIFKKNIEFKNVSFNYPDTKITSISNVSFEIKKNSIFAVTGISGSGKTTLVNLLLGLINPTSGSIFMDGINKNQIKKKNWFKNFAYVSQDLYLLDDTIKNNIAFGLSHDHVNVKKINKLIKLLNLNDFVENLSDGIDTNLGNRGLKISGGQRQRIGIARALYFEPKILVLDESTSALDKKNEYFLLNIFKKLKKKMTIIIIYHNQSATRICDKIIKLRDGKVIY